MDVCDRRCTLTRVVAAATPDEALVDLRAEQRPDLIICDYRLANGQSGVTAIDDLRNVYGASVLPHPSACARHGKVAIFCCTNQCAPWLYVP
jgi:CheY-like chemotaxis protein